MPVYTFTFPAAAGGLPVSIIDANADEVAADTLGYAQEVQGGIVLSATLATGTYAAVATDPPTYASFRAPGVLDVANSLNGGGGIGSPLVFGADSGGSIAANSEGTATAFDDVPDGLEPDTAWNIASGLYHAYVEFDFDEPELPTSITVRVTGGGSSPNVFGPVTLTPGALLNSARTLKVTFPVILAGEDAFSITLNATVDASAVDPEPLTYSYAWAALTKIA